MIVKNTYGTEIDFDAAVALMDDEIREDLHNRISPCTEQEFFSAYAEAHEKMFNEIWEPAKENPCF